MNRSLRKVPSFALYGEPAALAAAQRLHIEDIQSRSRRYLWEIGVHSHETLFQCVLISGGPATVTIDGNESQLPAPALALLPPASVHAFRFDAATRGFVLTIEPGALFEGEADPLRAAFAPLFAAPRVFTLPPAAAGRAQRLQGLLERLHDEFRQPDSSLSPVCTWLARSFLWIVAGELLPRQGDAPERQRRHRDYERFRTLLEGGYLRHWPVARYARALGLTPGRLNRLCVAQTGHSAHRLAQQRLALEARRRLAHVALPVAQIAHELGFRDPAYFCRFFKRHSGASPRQFREQRSRRGT